MSPATQIGYTQERLYTKTVRKLRIIAPLMEETMIETVDRLVEAEYDRLRVLLPGLDDLVSSHKKGES